VLGPGPADPLSERGGPRRDVGRDLFHALVAEAGTPMPVVLRPHCQETVAESFDKVPHVLLPGPARATAVLPPSATTWHSRQRKAAGWATRRRGSIGLPHSLQMP